MKRTFFLFLLISSLVKAAEIPLQEGDILFQEHPSDQRELIQLTSHSKYTHVGIVLPNPYDGKLYIYEAIGPVKFTPIQDWIDQGVGSHFVAKRLKKAEKVLKSSVLRKMEKVALGFYGKPYDWLFQWSDERIYCSELVWKIYKNSTGLELGRPKKLKEFDLSTSLAKDSLKERFGSHIPWDEKIISPGQMFDSDLLIQIASQ